MLATHAKHAPAPALQMRHFPFFHSRASRSVCSPRPVAGQRRLPGGGGGGMPPVNASASAGAPSAQSGAPGSSGGAPSNAAGEHSGGSAGVVTAAGAPSAGAGTSGANSVGGGSGGIGSGAAAGSAVTQAGAGGVSGSNSLPPHTGAWRITPLGDSITGTTCGPQLLAKALADHGKSNFVFVGSNLNNQSCDGAGTVQTEGHGGYLVTDLVGSGMHAAELPKWCDSNKADLVLMQFGTNDVWNDRSPSAILDAYATVLSDLRAANPNVIVMVAQITPLNPKDCSACEARGGRAQRQDPRLGVEQEHCGVARLRGRPARRIYRHQLYSQFQLYRRRGAPQRRRRAADRQQVVRRADRSGRTLKREPWPGCGLN